MAHETLPRRDALALLTLAATGCATTHATAGAHAGDDHDEDLPPTEDLMREHGVLRRVLLAYDEVIRRVHASEAFDPGAVLRAARVVRTFIEDYHERDEERWVFPVVRRTAALAPTVDVLVEQHRRGRTVTDEIVVLATRGPVAGSADAARMAALCEGFARMYRPHAAREDTVIFPALRASISRHALHELGEQMEAAEHASVGEGGFERAVAEVGAIERILGIDDLARFTPAAT